MIDGISSFLFHFIYRVLCKQEIFQVRWFIFLRTQLVYIICNYTCNIVIGNRIKYVKNTKLQIIKKRKSTSLTLTVQWVLFVVSSLRTHLHNILQGEKTILAVFQYFIIIISCISYCYWARSSTVFLWWMFSIFLLLQGSNSSFFFF